MTSYDWDIRCADVELSRLEQGFTGYDHANFARVFLNAYQRTIRDVHIETGSLLASGKAEPLVSSNERWEAQISYGGASAGVNAVVRYAASELFGSSARYGGPPSHDYLRSAAHIDEELAGPVSSFISRGRRTPHPEGTQR